ncbi:MAG: nitroreductase/quinone reductase family protein [Dehalococcoidia bacterium]
MRDDVRRALARDQTDYDRTIDITTTGRKSGLLRRTEIWFHNVEGRIYITGTPGRRGWLANLIANPELTFHLKHNAQADLPATARLIFQTEERRKVMQTITKRIGEDKNLEEWVERSPLIEVEFQVD